MPPGDCTVILLAGGLGTRLLGVHPDLPKVMAPVAGRPFLEWVLRYWIRQGLRKFIVSVGHRAGSIEEFLKTRTEDGISIAAEREERPLGTGGAARNAAQRPECSDPFLVANADSLVLADLSIAWPHFDMPDLDGLILAVEVADTSRYGSLAAGPDGTLLGFREKQPGRGIVNAGCYMFRKCLLPDFPLENPCSMEYDVLPVLIRNGARIKVVSTNSPFLDIGTPESLAKAEEFVAVNFSAPE